MRLTENFEDLRGVHTELTRLDKLVKANKTDIEDSLRNLNRGIDDKNNELSAKSEW